MTQVHHAVIIWLYWPVSAQSHKIHHFMTEHAHKNNMMKSLITDRLYSSVLPSLKKKRQFWWKTSSCIGEIHTLPDSNAITSSQLFTMRLSPRQPDDWTSIGQTRTEDQHHFVHSDGISTDNGSLKEEVVQVGLLHHHLTCQRAVQASGSVCSLLLFVDTVWRGGDGQSLWMSPIWFGCN